MRRSFLIAAAACAAFSGCGGGSRKAAPVPAGAQPLYARVTVITGPKGSLMRSALSCPDGQAARGAGLLARPSAARSACAALRTASVRRLVLSPAPGGCPGPGSAVQRLYVSGTVGGEKARRVFFAGPCAARNADWQAIQPLWNAILQPASQATRISESSAPPPPRSNAPPTPAQAREGQRRLEVFTEKVYGGLKKGQVPDCTPEDLRTKYRPYPCAQVVPEPGR